MAFTRDHLVSWTGFCGPGSGVPWRAVGDGGETHGFPLPPGMEPHTGYERDVGQNQGPLVLLFVTAVGGVLGPRTAGTDWPTS